MNIILYTDDGASIVREATIPKFQVIPGAIQWGPRVFQRRDEVVNEPYEYVECFVFTLNS